MEKDITKPAAGAVEEKLFDNWFDPVETILRDKVRGFLATMIEEELEAVLARPRYGRRQTSPDEEIPAPVTGHRHGHRTRRLMGTFGQTDITVPRARMIDEIGKTSVSANLAAPFTVEIGEACCVLKIEVDANGGQWTKASGSGCAFERTSRLRSPIEGTSSVSANLAAQSWLHLSEQFPANDKWLSAGSLFIGDCRFGV